ncbi:Dna-directed rna polymerase subunit beta like, partial [Thalictrum thalictroides]
SGYELPTRLAVAAADCILFLTEASTRTTNTSEVSNVETKSSETDTAKKPVALSFTACAKEKTKSTSAFVEKSKNMEVEVLLWDHLDELIILVQRLMA